MLCLHDLASLTGGRIHFGPMPPREGEWTHVRRIVLDSQSVQPGDLFWRLAGYPKQTLCSPQHALFRGAAGIAMAGEPIAPWPGTFCLEVENDLQAFVRLIEALEADRAECDTLFEEKIFSEAEKLQNLQLSALPGPGITPATCGRPTGERFRCRRKAA
jgi:hypothetical protein